MQEQYMKQNYTDWQTRTMTPFDEKLSIMRSNLQSKYKHIYENRSHTMLIETKTLIQKDELIQKQSVAVDHTKKQRAVVACEEVICTAITIKTNAPCGRKAKNGSFCGLHSKKVK